MRAVLRAAVLVLAVIGAPLAFAQQSFMREELASDAVRLEQKLRVEAGSSVQQFTGAQWREEAEAALRRDPRRAMALAGSAVAAGPKDAANWLVFARAALRVDPADGTQKWELRSRALSAAYAAFQKATDKAEQAQALALLGRLYAERDEWRPALDAYRASLDRVDDDDIRLTYGELREKHGFRLLDYKVDADSASPRICFQLSAPLQARFDPTPYVAVAGSAAAAITGEDRQLCVDGLKHGERYAVTIRQGLPSSVGEALLKSSDYQIYVRDRAPQARFTGKNYVLPRVGQEGIPVVSVNTKKLDIEILRIGDRNLPPTVRSEDFLAQIGGYRARDIANEKGQRVWRGTMDVAGELNRDVVTAFPVNEAVGRLEPGVYVMTARPFDGALDSLAAGPNDGDEEESADDDGQRATQWFVVSDLGLTAFAGPDGVHVLVRSLASAEPLAGTQIRLLARNNEVLASKPTDASGYVRFDPGLARGDGGLAPGLVVASDSKGDYGFLDLGMAAFDLTDRGVKGRAAPKGLDAFLYAERGVYRSGETVYVTSLLRDSAGIAAAALPLTLVVKRPDGVEYQRAAVPDQGLGGRALAVPLLSGAQRGTWRVQAYADPKGPAIGETSFLVEDYVPERLEIELKPRQPALRPGEAAEIDVSARYLYGAPGSGLDVGGDVTVELAQGKGLPGLEGYEVGLADEPFEAATGEIDETATTDDTGKAMLLATIPQAATQRLLQARITVSVGESGGRAVQRALTLPILPKGTVIGVKKLFGELGKGSLASFDAVTVGPDGQRVARRKLQWTLQRIDKRYQWFRQDGRWSFEPVTSTQRVADGEVDVGAAGAPARVAAPVDWGSYRLDMRSPDDGAQTSVAFTVGWSGDATAETPDLLDIGLDKPAYAAGDMLGLRIGARFAGKATVAVIGDRLLALKVVDVKPGDTIVPVAVGADWGAGAYAVAFAHRPLDAVAKRMPGRALGLAWFAIDKAAHGLAVTVDAPAKIRPRGRIDLPIRLAGLAPGEEAYVTVAAVDVGILNLTRYEPPKPSDYFFGQRQLGAEIRDLYGYLIDGMQATRGAIRSGGDGAGLTGDTPPPTQEPVARYSGVVRVGPDGTAMVGFDIPAFNGTLRVMTVAWARGRVGEAVNDVIIRDPVVVQGTLPRFLSLGDHSRFFVQFDNVEGPAGDYSVELDVHGPLIVGADAGRRVIALKAGGKGALTIPVTAAGLGTGVIDLRLTGPGGLDAVQSFALKLEPGTSAVYRRSVRPLPPGASAEISGDLVADFVPGTGSIALSVSPLAGIDVPALLQALDRYPYGCSEQIVSRAMPLLYVNRLAEASALALDPDIDKRLREAIETLLARQESNGSFGLWSVGGPEDYWLDGFVTDFLTRARERGFAVPQRAFDMALDRLRNFVANTTDVGDDNGGALAYAVYVLARNGRPVMGDLRYLADTKLASFTSPLARAQIAASLAMLGDRRRAQLAFGSAVEGLGAESSRLSRRDYGSRLRDSAGTLALIAETGAARDQIQRVGLIVEQARGAAALTSTQENGWMVLAAQALAREAEGLRLSVDGEPHKGAFYRTLSGFGLESRALAVTNSGQTPAQLVVTVSGAPTVPEPAASQGFTVERGLYRLDGTKLDSATLKQNDRVIVVLKMTEPEAKYGRVLLVDPLPAGLEIDNPALVDGSEIKGLDWIKTDVEPVHVEYRDDRFVAAFDRDAGQSAFFTAAYVARAVSPGRYVHPPATVEDMYRPDRFGRTAFGGLDVSAAKP